MLRLHDNNFRFVGESQPWRSHHPNSTAKAAMTTAM
jgi:hypothetical protein